MGVLAREDCLLLEPDAALAAADPGEAERQEPDERVEDDEGDKESLERRRLERLEEKGNQQVWRGDRPDCRVEGKRGGAEGPSVTQMLTV